MFEEPADDRPDADRVGQPADAGTQAADPANREIDPHAGGRGLVQRIDRLRVHERIELEDDPALTPERRLLTDHLDDPLAQRDRSHEEPPVPALPAVPGQEVEQIGDVVPQLLIRGEETQVFVQARGVGVVVARP